MGFPSFAASNAVIYVTYGAFLFVFQSHYTNSVKTDNQNSIMGTGIAWRMRNQPKADFLSGNGTQTGQNLSTFEMLTKDKDIIVI